MGVHLLATQTRATSVMLVDDHRTVAHAVALAVCGEADLDCVGTAHTVAEAWALAETLRPDVVVTEVSLSDGDGLAAAAQLIARWPDTRVVVLTAEINRAVLQRAADAGACALLAKDAALTDLLHAIRSARRDHLMVAPNLVKALMASPRLEPLLEGFTRREHEVRRELADGSDARVTARALGISLPNCRGYIKAILAKLGAHTQLEAVVIAHRRGLARVGARYRHPAAASPAKAV